MNYIEVMRAYSSHFERLTRGNHHKWEQGRLQKRPSQVRVAECVAEQHENTHENTPTCCPACGSVSVKKSGKTLAKRQRWACKDCGKTFV